MFTGIVEEMGVVKTFEKTLGGTQLRILAKSILSDVKTGDSISINGTCLTVVVAEEHEFLVEVSPETLSVTSLGSLQSGVPVNLERAMKLGDRLGGHLVSGHVDGLGVIVDRKQDGNAILLTIEAPQDIIHYCVPKGSITIDGISMTINDIRNRTFSLAVIPHTAQVTTLGLKQKGDQVNLESDMIGKYVERLLGERGQAPVKPAPVIDKDYLQKRGLI